MTTLPSQRHLFDIPRDIAYFNCAYYSPQLNASRDRLLEGVRAKSHPWTRVAAGFFDDAERTAAMRTATPSSPQRVTASVRRRARSNRDSSPAIAFC